MKVVFTILAVVLFCTSAIANVDLLHKANKASVAWDAADGATSYRVYTQPLGGGEPTHIADTQTPEYTIEFSADGAVLVGVQSVRAVLLPGMIEPTEEVSTISWSNIATVCLNGQTFGLYWMVPPGNAYGLRKN
jgi:hypothetical protein